MIFLLKKTLLISVKKIIINIYSKLIAYPERKAPVDLNPDVATDIQPAVAVLVLSTLQLLVFGIVFLWPGMLILTGTLAISGISLIVHMACVPPARSLPALRTLPALPQPTTSAVVAGRLACSSVPLSIMVGHSAAGSARKRASEKPTGPPPSSAAAA